MKIYRNVYLKSNLPKFTGREIIYYYGKIITNAENNPSVTKEFNRNEDIYISCNCDAPKYAAIIKKNKLNIEKNKKRDIKNYVKKCKNCTSRGR